MITLLASVTRDVRRLDRVIDDPLVAREIVTQVLGVEPTHVASTTLAYSTNDYLVDIDDSAVLSRQEYVDFGVIDAALTNVGRVTATVVAGPEV